MNFSIEITMKTDLSNLPKIKDVYVTMLPGHDYRDVAKKASELVKAGFNPVPHFPARSIKHKSDLKSSILLRRDVPIKSFQIDNINYGGGGGGQ